MSDAMTDNKSKIMFKRKLGSKVVVEDEIIPQEMLIDVSKEKDNNETESEEAVRELKRKTSGNENMQAKRMSVKHTRETTPEKEVATQGPGSETKKKKVNKALKAQVGTLTDEVKDLNKAVVKAHQDGNDRLTLVLQAFQSSKPPPS